MPSNFDRVLSVCKHKYEFTCANTYTTQQTQTLWKQKLMLQTHFDPCCTLAKQNSYSSQLCKRACSVCSFQVDSTHMSGADRVHQLSRACTSQEDMYGHHTSQCCESGCSEQGSTLIMASCITRQICSHVLKSMSTKTEAVPRFHFSPVLVRVAGPLRGTRAQQGPSKPLAGLMVCLPGGSSCAMLPSPHSTRFKCRHLCRVLRALRLWSRRPPMPPVGNVHTCSDTQQGVQL